MHMSVENTKDSNTANTIVHIAWQEKMDKAGGKLLHTNLNQETKPEASNRFGAIHEYKDRTRMLGSMVKEIEPSDTLWNSNLAIWKTMAKLYLH